MSRLTFAVLATALTVTIAVSPALAADATIADLNIGTHWYGPQITKKDLAGKVVLVELWGK